MSKFEIVYNNQTGSIVTYCECENEQTYELLPEELSVLFLDEVVPIDLSAQSIDLETLSVVNETVDYAAIRLLASWADIKRYRNEFSNRPIAVTAGLLDIDSTSMEILQLAEEQFDILPTVTNGELAWKMADNSYVYLEYQDVVLMNTEAKQLKAQQVATMFYQAEVFRAMSPAPTLDYVASYDNWIEP